MSLILYSKSLRDDGLTKADKISWSFDFNLKVVTQNKKLNTLTSKRSRKARYSVCPFSFETEWLGSSLLSPCLQGCLKKLKKICGHIDSHTHSQSHSYTHLGRYTHTHTDSYRHIQFQQQRWISTLK